MDDYIILALYIPFQNNSMSSVQILSSLLVFLNIEFPMKLRGLTENSVEVISNIQSPQYILFLVDAWILPC